MKAAVISLTARGTRLAAKIADALREECVCVRYNYVKYPCEGALPFDNLRLLIQAIFHEYDALIFLCACGIAVRMVAPCLTSKWSDPAVIAIDERGKFAVSLLSGHVGGANALTRRVADVLNAVPVVTTATDAGGIFSPDTFAAANGLHIVEPNAAKAVAAALVNGEKIGLVSQYEYCHLPEAYFTLQEAEVGICIADNADSTPFAITLHLLPRNTVIGVGCKKGTPCEWLDEFVQDCLRRNGIAMERVAALHTLDIKREEPAIQRFCRVHDIALEAYTAQELMAVEGEFAHSDFVLKTTGADNVCERAAAAGGSVLIVRKIAQNGMTFAAARREVIIDFGRGAE